jgi:hypothetical protein
MIRIREARKLTVPKNPDPQNCKEHKNSTLVGIGSDFPELLFTVLMGHKAGAYFYKTENDFWYKHKRENCEKSIGILVNNSYIVKLKCPCNVGTVPYGTVKMHLAV